MTINSAEHKLVYWSCLIISYIFLPFDKNICNLLYRLHKLDNQPNLGQWILFISHSINKSVFSVWNIFLEIFSKMSLIILEIFVIFSKRISVSKSLSFLSNLSSAVYNFFLYFFITIRRKSCNNCYWEEIIGLLYEYICDWSLLLCSFKVKLFIY